jgi:hypothetical protein
MLTRFVLLGALFVLTACGGSPPADDGDTSPPSAVPTTGVAPGDGPDDGSGSVTPGGTPIGLPADACQLLDPITVARLAGGRQATGKSSAQGPFHSCEYRVTPESGAEASVFLDVSDQRAAQLYEVATAGVQLSALPAIGTRASLSPDTGKVYVLTSHAFFTLALPPTFGALTTKDGLRTAAEQLAAAIVSRLGP